jgi:hypothetical protein
VIDLNRTVTKRKASSDAINAAIDTTMVALGSATSNGRNYLGASSLGHDCLRKIQWDWRHPTQPEARTARIFARGHWWEDYASRLMAEAGFRMVRQGPALGFSQLDGRFQGHADGIIIAGPEVEEVTYPALWECKGLGSKGWTKLSKEGLAKAYPTYADQVALYQAYLDLADHPAVFTACNMDTMEMLHLLVPFDAARAQAASDRAVLIIKADEGGETLPRCTDYSDDWRCRFCNHNARCWDGQ